MSSYAGNCGLLTDHLKSRLNATVLTRLDIADALGAPLYTMNRLRPVMMMLGLAVLLVTTGDCINLAFADAKAAECCLRTDCPLAAEGQMDSCCKSPVSPAKYIQGTSQKSISQPSVKDVEFPAEAFGPILKIAGNSSVDGKFHAPPGGLNILFTPLLI